MRKLLRYIARSVFYIPLTKEVSDMSAKESTPVTLPHTVNVRVPGAFDYPTHGRALLTLNSTPIFGHPAGSIVLTTFLARPYPQGTKPEGYELTYKWCRAESQGGISPDKLYSAYDHTTLPGVLTESKEGGK